MKRIVFLFVCVPVMANAAAPITSCPSGYIAIDAPWVSEEEFLKIARNFYLGVPSELDIVHYNKIRNPLLKSEIDRKGVVMYLKRV